MEISPEVGGALVSAQARHDGGWLSVMRSVDASTAIAARDVRRLASFVLAPFANRLENAHFTYDGVIRTVPPNWPPDPGTAIHGLSWQRPWTIESHTQSRLELTQHIDEPDYAFRYDARLIYDVSGEAAVTSLSVRNAGDAKLPFGLGFHPYFRRSSAAIVRFSADGWLEADSRCFPVAWHPLDQAKDARNGLPVRAFEGLDVSFTGWTREATLTWPESGARLQIEASDTAKALLVYVPPSDPGFLCLEPVTHAIDVLNRRNLAP